MKEWGRCEVAQATYSLYLSRSSAVTSNLHCHSTIVFYPKKDKTLRSKELTIALVEIYPTLLYNQLTLLMTKAYRLGKELPRKEKGEP